MVTISPFYIFSGQTALTIINLLPSGLDGGGARDYPVVVKALLLALMIVPGASAIDVETPGAPALRPCPEVVHHVRRGVRPASLRVA